jgi:hypothetical protein
LEHQVEPLPLDLTLQEPGDPRERRVEPLELVHHGGGLGPRLGRRLLRVGGGACEGERENDRGQDGVV